MIKRTLMWIGLAAVGLALMIAVEILLAMRRDYLPTEPALDIRGRFGPVEEPVTLAVVGDSTGAGVGAGTVEKSYPYLLGEKLAESQDRAIEMFSVAKSGARVATVLDEGQVSQALLGNPNVILVVIGANDVTHLTRLGSLEEDVKLMVERLRAGGAPVVLAGAPDMRAPAFYEPLRSVVGWRGQAVTETIEVAARGAGAVVVPLADRTRDFFAQNPDTAYSRDDFHPGPAGYEAWANALFPEVDAVFSSLPF